MITVRKYNLIFLMPQFYSTYVRLEINNLYIHC